MCSNYGIDGKALGRFLDVMENTAAREAFVLAFDRPMASIRPTDAAPVLLDDAGTLTLRHLRWGLIPRWSRGPAPRGNTINARSETVQLKPSFREAFRERRCLVPASYWHEWTGPAGRMTKHTLRTDDDAIVFAGLWEAWRGPDASVVQSFTVLTTAAPPSIADLHDRIPVLLAPSDIPTWLSGSPQTAHSLLQPYAGAIHISPPRESLF